MQGYQFINFIDLEYEDTAMIIENMNTRQVRFLQLACYANEQIPRDDVSYYEENHDEQTIQNSKKLQFEQLGLVQRITES